MAQKVFKIPDGKGGFTYQIQTPDGKWHITDENGNPIPEKKDVPAEMAPAVPATPKTRKTRKKTPVPPDELSFVQFGLKIPKEAMQHLIRRNRKLNRTRQEHRKQPEQRTPCIQNSQRRRNRLRRSGQDGFF